jgi:hypothetical protein
MMIVMNLIIFCQKTKLHGFAFYNIKTGDFDPKHSMSIIDGTTKEHKGTESVRQDVKSYVLENLELLYDEDNYLSSRIHEGNLRLFISKIIQ